MTIWPSKDGIHAPLFSQLVFFALNHILSAPTNSDKKHEKKVQKCLAFSSLAVFIRPLARATSLMSSSGMSTLATFFFPGILHAVVLARQLWSSCTMRRSSTTQPACQF
ncbi:hypothetical protein J3R82DRAFT_8994 [Butyriboletus roseoflavus]|nr:hypothetical protein J3R82DRAFT_8994 [Butyriboletus roseoflavus]